jgi:hypothetical protein
LFPQAVYYLFDDGLSSFLDGVYDCERDVDFVGWNLNCCLREDYCFYLLDTRDLLGDYEAKHCLKYAGHMDLFRKTECWVWDSAILSLRKYLFHSQLQARHLKVHCFDVNRIRHYHYRLPI